MIAHVILTRAAGNPGLARLVVESLIAGGGLERAGTRWVATPVADAIDLGSHLRDLVSARLASVAPSARELVEIGAVIGLSFDPELAAAALSIEDLTAARDGAEATRLLGPAPRGHLRFIQSSHRDAILEQLSSEQRRQLNAQVATTLLRREEELDLEQRISLSLHLLAAEAQLPAVPRLLAAAVEIGALPLGLDLARRAFPLRSASRSPGTL